VEEIVKLSFILWATSVPPEIISKRTGITPSIEMLRGERNPDKVLPRQNLWALESSVHSDELSEHWYELEKVLRNSRAELKAIAQTGQAKFTVVINADYRLPSIIIPPSMSEFAGFLNAMIDIDHLQR
jgi:hypothetical protein